VGVWMGGDRVVVFGTGPWEEKGEWEGEEEDGG